MISTDREVNTHKTNCVIAKIKNPSLKFEKENTRKAIVVCMGLAFIQDIDDLREFPALHITKNLIY